MEDKFAKPGPANPLLRPFGKTGVRASLHEWFQSYLRKLNTEGSKNADATRLIMIGWIAIVGFPLYYWVWQYLYPQAYENLWLRLLGMLLAVPFVLARRWNRKPWFDAYFFVALTFMEPFFFTYMFLMNSGSLVWSQSLLIAIVALFQFFQGKVATNSFIVGTALAYLAYVLQVDHAGWPSQDIMVNVPIILFAILLISVSKVSRRFVEEEKLGSMASVLGTVSHEMRTPLLSVTASARGLSRYLPILVRVYRKYTNELEPDEQIPPGRLKMIEPALERIQFEVRYMNSIIELLLANSTRPEGKAYDIQVFDMGEVVRQTVAHFPFENAGQRALVSVDIQSPYSLAANEDLCRMVLINLVKNGLRAIMRANKGALAITVKDTPGGGCLIVRDTGCGIPRSQLPHIFTRFYSYPAADGTGIGLAFCKATLGYWGAKITCRSEEHLYTEFTIQFQRARKPEMYMQ